MEAEMDALILAELPPVDAGPEIEQFANALDDCLSLRLSDDEKRERLLGLPRKYYENTKRRLTQLGSPKERNSHDDVDMEADELEGTGVSKEKMEQSRQIELETQTWDLLDRVLRLRYPDPGTAAQLSRLHKVADKPALTDGLQSFFETNSVARERRAVLKWLQTNASSGPDIDARTRNLQQSADRGDIIAHGWLHTRSAIKLKKSITGWKHLLDQQSTNLSTTHVTGSGAPMVTQLDPDATSRQGLSLEPQDEYFERAIWLGCYEHLRRGSNLKTIREWCEERTEMWRAVSMSGLLLSASEEDHSGDLEPTSLALWRRMCFRRARRGGSDDFECAVYGVLSGDIISVEKVARTWDDFLFTHYNALLRTQIDSFVLDRCPPGEASSLTQTFPSFDAVQFHGEDADVEKRLIQALESRPELKDEAFEPNKALQASIVSKEVSGFLYKQGLFLSSSTGSEVAVDQKYFKSGNGDGLRIISHVYVLVTLLERLSAGHSHLPHELKLPEHRAAENILAHYADFLRRARLEELIPVYCSILEPPRRYEVLCSSLILEESAERRLELLNLMKRANIDVLQFVKTQATLLYDKARSLKSEALGPKTDFSIHKNGPLTARLGRGIKADFFGEDPDAVEPSHEHLIRSLEWLLMVTETWPNVFSMGVLVYKFFLQHMQLRAARKLLKKVSFAGIMQDLGADDDFDEAWYDNAAFWREQLERTGAQGTTPQQVLADARTFRELEALVRALDSLETVGAFAEVADEYATSAQDANVAADKRSAPPGQRDFWNQVGDAIKATKDNMGPLLKNWLVSGIQGGDEELSKLRQAFLPETVLAYVSALHFAGTGLSRDWLLECMHLASLVAERDSDLEDTFVKARRVKELLDALAAASKALAIATGDRRATGTGSKKLREMGWSRDVWSVKS